MFILAINPGSTSTKIAAYKNEKEVFETTLRHDPKHIAKFKDIPSQYDFRLTEIQKVLKAEKFDITKLDAVVGRGGLFPKKKMKSGTYKVTAKMIKDVKERPVQAHASNLGCMLADAFAKQIKKPAFIVDPVVVDELADVARISGHKGYQRKSMLHALNQKAIGLEVAKVCKKPYTRGNFIIAHLGGGVSVGAHQKGNIIDVNKALLGEGPMSPERTGTLAIEDVINITLDNNAKGKTKGEIFKLFVGKGGMYTYAKTTDMREVEALAKKDPKIKLAVDAFIYQIAKEIGSNAAVLKGKVDGIAVTGGIAYSKYITAELKKYVSWIAPVHIFPGEDEMLALVKGAGRGIKKPATLMKY